MKRYLNGVLLVFRRGFAGVKLLQMMRHSARSTGKLSLVSLVSSVRKGLKDAIKVLSGVCTSRRSWVEKGEGRYWLELESTRMRGFEIDEVIDWDRDELNR